MSGAASSSPLLLRILARLPCGVELEPLVVWDSSPFLLPLARLKKEYQDYGLLLIDSQEARLFLIRSDVVVEKKRASIDLMNKHKKGGLEPDTLQSLAPWSHKGLPGAGGNRPAEH